jgi:hypothetical protein
LNLSIVTSGFREAFILQVSSIHLCSQAAASFEALEGAGLRSGSIISFFSSIHQAAATAANSYSRFRQQAFQAISRFHIFSTAEGVSGIRFA